MNNLKGWIFDLDGVITKTDDYHFQSFNEMMKSKFDILLRDNDNDLIRGIARKQAVTNLLNKYNIDFIEDELLELCELKNEIYKEKLNNLNNSHIINGVIESIELLKSKGKILAIASVSKNATLILEKLNIKKYFDFIVDASKLEKSKPDPEIFNKAVQGLGLNNNQCIVIEDSQAGIDGSNKANLTTIGIDWENKLKYCTYCVKDMEEFLQLVKKLKG